MTDLRPWERPLGCLLKLVVAFGVLLGVFVLLGLLVSVGGGWLGSAP